MHGTMCETVRLHEMIHLEGSSCPPPQTNLTGPRHLLCWQWRHTLERWQILCGIWWHLCLWCHGCWLQATHSFLIPPHPHTHIHKINHSWFSGSFACGTDGIWQMMKRMSWEGVPSLVLLTVTPTVVALSMVSLGDNGWYFFLSFFLIFFSLITLLTICFVCLFLVYHITEKGWKHISAEDSNDLYWERYGRKEGNVLDRL